MLIKQWVILYLDFSMMRSSDDTVRFSEAKLLPHIVVDGTGKISCKVATDVLSCDVTGGIEFKLKSAIDIVLQSKGCTHVFVCQVGSGAAESVCIDGHILDGEEGTVISLREGSCSTVSPSSFAPIHYPSLSVSCPLPDLQPPCILSPKSLWAFSL